MEGGMVSSTVLTLLVIPAIYSLWKQWEVRRDTKYLSASAADERGPRPELADAGV
jgi:Cu(I)/Ag(I) efflux system membrane protein CusA/SilA